MIINIPIYDPKNPPVLKFPERCVGCGKSKETVLGIALNMGVQNRNRAVTMQLTVPMCNACAEKDRSIAKVTLIPFMIAGFLIGVIVFVPVAFIAPEGTTPQTLGFSLVLGGFAGLIAVFLAELWSSFLSKMPAVPFYGKLLARRPLTIIGFLAESDDLIGISVRFCTFGI